MQISKEEHQLNDYMKIKANSEASTAPVERIFSSGGEVTRGKRNRLTDKNLEREIFLRRNKKYID